MRTKDAELRHPTGDTLSAPKARRDRIRRMREAFRARSARGAFQPLFLCAAKKKPLAVKRKRQRGISISPFGIPLKRPRRGLRPPSWIFPGVWLVQSVFQTSKKRDADAYRTDRRGSRNTLRCSRADRVVRPYVRSETCRILYVKYSTGTNLAIRDIYRALRKPDSSVARRAFLDRRCNDNT